MLVVLNEPAPAVEPRWSPRRLVETANSSGTRLPCVDPSSHNTNQPTVLGGPVVEWLTWGHAYRHRRNDSHSAFFRPRRPKEDHVLTVGQEAQVGQLLNLFAVNRGLEAEVEGQGFLEGEVSEPPQRRPPPPRQQRVPDIGPDTGGLES